MPQPTRPPLLVEADLEDYNNYSNKVRSTPLQRKSIQPERLKQLQESHRVLVDGHLTAPVVLTQRFSRKDVRSLPKEILLKVFNEYLSPYDMVALALTTRFFYEVVPWACQKPVKLIVPPCQCPLVLYDYCSAQRRTPTPCQDLVAHARLFRETLHTYFGPDYIYCGGPDKPAMRRIFPLKHLTNNEEHQTCCCRVSLVEREIEILKAEKRGAPLKRSTQHLRQIQVAQERMTPKSGIRGHDRQDPWHPVYSNARHWPWTSDINWATVKMPWARSDRIGLAAAFVAA